MLAIAPHIIPMTVVFLITVGIAYWRTRRYMNRHWPVSDEDDMKKEYDFSKGTRGKFAKKRKVKNK